MCCQPSLASAYPNFRFLNLNFGQCVYPILKTSGFSRLSNFSKTVFECKRTCPAVAPYLGRSICKAGSDSMARKKDSALSRESIVGPTHPSHDFPLLQPVGLVDDVTGTQEEHGGRSWTVTCSRVPGEWKVEVLVGCVGANNYICCRVMVGWIIYCNKCRLETDLLYCRSSSNQSSSSSTIAERVSSHHATTRGNVVAQ